MPGPLARIRDRDHDLFVRDRIQVVVTRDDGGAGLLVLTQVLDGEVMTEDWVPADATVPGRAAVLLDVREDVARAVYVALRDRYEPELATDNRLTVDLSDATDRQPRQRIAVPAELADGFERAVALANRQAR